MAVVWKQIAYKGELFHLFEVDVGGDLMPSISIISDEYFESDGSNDIMPRETVFQLDSLGDLMPA